MAKKNRRRSTKTRVTRQRANPMFRQDVRRLLPVSSVPYTRPKIQKQNITFQKSFKKSVRKLLHDRRLWKPERQRNVLTYGKEDKITRYVLRSRTVAGKPYKTAPRQGFADFKRHEICKRRVKRRESLFATGNAGRGIRNTAKKVLNIYSKVRCK